MSINRYARIEENIRVIKEEEMIYKNIGEYFKEMIEEEMIDKTIEGEMIDKTIEDLNKIEGAMKEESITTIEAGTGVIIIVIINQKIEKKERKIKR